MEKFICSRNTFTMFVKAEMSDYRTCKAAFSKMVNAKWRFIIHWFLFGRS
ncbi:hypothetical protein MKY19_03495 [Paenibacillus sp. FSL R5-0744]